MLTKHIILKYLTDHKEEFYKKYSVKKIGLFGSYARDEADENSDIDLLVDMPSSFKNYFELKYLLEQEFGKSVDLGEQDSLRLFIKKRVEKELIYAE
ncbi:MAG: hypothetical protein GQ570_09700 [Helicobacteraceae bacterium]|nr:hypothetical protein [Helicobacteraceae bacterium]